MIKEFNATVTQTTNVVLKIDTDKFSPEFMEEFRKSFYDFTSLIDHVEHIAQYAVRFDKPTFLEGYGAVTYEGKPRWNYSVEEYGELFGIDIKVGREQVDIDIDN